MFVFFSCEDDDNSAGDNTNAEDFRIEDQIYRLTGLIITEPVDLNGDGVYSLNIFDENPCLTNFEFVITFYDEKAIHPAWTGFALSVEDDSNGNPEQIGTCGFISGTLPFWKQNDNTILYYYDTWESPDIIGELSEDGQQIHLTAAAESNAIMFREILREDGTVINYQDNIKLIYTLMEE